MTTSSSMASSSNALSAAVYTVPIPTPTPPSMPSPTSAIPTPAKPTAEPQTKTQEAEKKTSMLLHKYKWLLSQYQELQAGSLLVTAKGEQTEFTKNTLLKVIEVVDSRWNEAVVRTNGVMFTIDGMKFVMKIDTKITESTQKEAPQKKEEQLILMRYSNWKKIEEGSTGLIKKVFLVCKAAYAVLKEVKYPPLIKEKFDNATYGRFSQIILREGAILKRLHDQTKDKLKHIQHKPLTIINAEKPSKHFVQGLLFPYQYDCDLVTSIDNRGTLNSKERLEKCKEVIEAAAEAWSLNCAHGDIKPDNFFVFQNTILLGDFGVATLLADSATLRASLWGTRMYLSQQDYSNRVKSIHKKDLSYQFQISLQADIFALGTILYLFLTRGMTDPYGTLLNVGYGTGLNQNPFPQGQFIFNFRGSNEYSLELISFLRKMLELDPEKRPSVQEVVAFWKELDISKAVIKKAASPAALPQLGK